MDLILFLTGCALIALVPLVLDCAAARRRVRMLRQQAERLGFSFQASGSPFQDSDVTGLALLQADPSALTLHVMRRSQAGCETVVFDLAHYVPLCSALVETTVAGFRCPSRQLPVLEIGDRSLIHRIDDVIEGKVDVDLGPGSEFFVHCANGGALRDFLTAEKLARLRACAHHLKIESSHEWLLIYRPGKKTPPPELSRFVETASVIASVLLAGTSETVPEHSN
jgi:hypothetical protein